MTSHQFVILIGHNSAELWWFAISSIAKLESNLQPGDAAKIDQFLKVREWTSQLNYLIKHVLEVTWLLHMRLGASKNPPKRHSKLEVQEKSSLILRTLPISFRIVHHLYYVTENIWEQI